MDVDAVLLDIDGVLVVSWEAIPGAADTVEWLRANDVAHRFVTNTTTRSRAEIATALGDAGIVVEPDELLTAPLATAELLRREHPEATVLLVSNGDAGEDFGGVHLVRPDELGPSDTVDVVLLGGAGPEFDYDTLNLVFGVLLDGAPLVAMHRNLYWQTSSGTVLDTGAYVASLEAAADVTATVMGKPSPDFFAEALRSAGVEHASDRTVMVGDDVRTDVLAAQDVGLRGVLVRTGKFREAAVQRLRDDGEGEPDVVIDSIVDLPALLDGDLGAGRGAG